MSGQLSHMIKYWSVDEAGNIEGFHIGYVNIDSTAPTTTASGLQTSATTGWITGSQLVTLTPNDAVSGLAGTYYTLDGGAQQTYLTPFTVSGDRSHVITYWSVDNAGNKESTHTGYVNIDSTAPTTTAIGLQTSATTGWRNTAQTVSLSATDGGSGMSGGSAATYYTLDGGGQQTYTTPFSVSGQLSHVITYWSVDAVGNLEGFHTGYVNIDTTAPTVGDNADSSWHNTDVTVTLSPNDSGGSGLAGTYYRVSGASTWTPTNAGTFVVQAPPDGSADGSHAYQYEAVDVAGNSSAIGTCTVWIDTTDPTTTASGLQPDVHTGWRSTSQVVSLSAGDGSGSQVTATYYTLDGGGQQTYTEPFTVSGNAQHVVTYWSVDNAGNVESTHIGYVNISNPFVQAAGLANDAYSGWQNSSPSDAVTLTAYGVNPPLTIHYSAGAGWVVVGHDSTSFTVSGDGSHEVDYYVADQADTQSPMQTGYVNIDTVAPTTTATGLQANGTTGWSTASVIVTLTGSDDRSGLKTTYYTVGNNPRTTYDGPFAVSGNGSHAISYWSVDDAGNAETAHTGYVNIDSTPPTVTSNADSLWHNSPVTVNLNATDALSGVASTQYRLAGRLELDRRDRQRLRRGRSGQRCQRRRPRLPVPGARQGRQRQRDGQCTVRIDTQGPTVTNDADSYWHNSAVTVHLTASDAQAGVASVSYRATGTTSWTTTSGATSPDQRAAARRR